MSDQTTVCSTRFRKKPVVIEAMQWTGGNSRELCAFCPTLITTGIDDDGAEYNRLNPLVPTLEGQMMCKVGDWIIKGVKGEFYPCKPDIFEATYEPA